MLLRERRGSNGRRWLPLRAPLLALALAAPAALPLPAAAQQPHRAPDGTVLTEEQARAQQHFQRAKDLYFAGSYREAAAELEVARKLDPKAKDLVLNLGIVHEKLARYDEALAYLKTYLEMEGVTAAERGRVEGMIKRIEGAKRELPVRPAQPQPPPGARSAAPSAPPPPPARGRVDALTITAGSIAAVGLLGGGALGVYALTTRPDDFVTGRDGSYATLQQKTDDAHTVAIVADVALGVGLIAAAITAWLYFGRTKDPTATSARVTGAPLPGGGALVAGGTF